MTRAETASGTAAAAADLLGRVDRSPWTIAVFYVALTRAVFLVAAYAATMLFTAGPVEGFLETWTRWDARHFLAAAEHGWSGPQAVEARTAAFFPLYPLAIRGLDGLGFNPILAGLVVSGIASVVACAFLIKLVDREVGPEAGRRAAQYLLLFPTAVFLIAPYSEALFLAGAIPAWYFARQGRWVAAAIPLMVATATRFAGVFLIAGLLVELLRQLWARRRERPLRVAGEGAVALAAGGLPILLFGLFLEAARGSFFQFRIDQMEGWGRSFVTPLQSFLATWNTRVGQYDSNWIFAWRIEILAAMAGLLLTAWALAKREWGYAVYMGVFMAVLMTSAWYFSIPRMLLTFFPAIVFLAELTKDHQKRHETALLIMAPVATMGVIVFTRGSWFF